MAQRVNIVLEDDLDGSEADETVTFALDGVTYEIDLNAKNAAALDSAWIGGQQGWADLSSAGRVQRVDQAGHFIQNDQPQAVADAVREVVAGQGG